MLINQHRKNCQDEYCKKHPFINCNVFNLPTLKGMAETTCIGMHRNWGCCETRSQFVSTRCKFDRTWVIYAARMKWCCMSMCFVREWWVGFLASAMHPWLSHMMVVAPTCTSPTSAINFLNHMASLVHWLVAMYSASVVDKAIVCCLLQFHEMAPTPTKNTYPVVERLIGIRLEERLY
jgi:hypothetical protein